MAEKVRRVLIVSRARVSKSRVSKQSQSKCSLARLLTLRHHLCNARSPLRPCLRRLLIEEVVVVAIPVAAVVVVVAGLRLSEAARPARARRHLVRG